MTFLDHIKKIIKDSFTGKDGVTYDIGRMLWVKGAIIYNALSVYTVIHNHTFDFVAWGTGFGAVLAAGGIALFIKKDTEPQEK